MNNNTLLISFKTLTGSSDVSENIDPKIILPLIKEVQEMRVQPVIGTKLFEKLKQDITDGNLTGFYKVLIDDHIKELMIHSILNDLPYKMNFRFTNSGVINHAAAKSTEAIQEKDLQKIMDFYKARAKFYAARLTDYIKANIIEFPEYNDNGCTDLRPTGGQYEVGVYLG